MRKSGQTVVNIVYYILSWHNEGSEEFHSEEICLSLLDLVFHFYFGAWNTIQDGEDIWLSIDWPVFYGMHVL